MLKTYCDRCGKDTDKSYAVVNVNCRHYGENWYAYRERSELKCKDLCHSCADLIIYHFEHGMFGNVKLDVANAGEQQL